MHGFGLKSNQLLEHVKLSNWLIMVL